MRVAVSLHADDPKRLLMTRSSAGRCASLLLHDNLQRTPELCGKIVMMSLRAGCAPPPADPAAAAADGGAAVRLQKQIAFSGLTVELFEDLDEGPDPHEPDVASFSQQLVCSAAVERPPNPAGSGGEAMHDMEEDEAFALVPPSALRAGGGAGAAARPSAEARAEGPGPGHSPAENPARDRPDGASETDGWDDDMSPFELLPGMPGCQAAGSDPTSDPVLNPLRNPNVLPAAGAGAPGELGQSSAPWGQSPAASDVIGSGAEGDGRHVVICSAEGVGCSGDLRLLLTWRTPAQAHPCVHAELTLEPLQVRALLRPACCARFMCSTRVGVHTCSWLQGAPDRHDTGPCACWTQAHVPLPLVWEPRK